MTTSYVTINASGDKLLIAASGPDALRLDVGLGLAAQADAVSSHLADMTTDILFSGTAAAVSGSSALFGIPRTLNSVCMVTSGHNANLKGPTRFVATCIVQSGREATIVVSRPFDGTAPAISGFSAFLDIEVEPLDLSVIFASEVIRPVILVDLELDAAPLRIWTGLTDLFYRNATYKALSGFDTGVSIRESIGLDVLATDFRLSGLQLEFLSISLTENYQGRLCRIYMGALDSRGEFLGRELLFTGYLDDMPISLAADRADILIKAANVLTRNSRALGLRYTPEDQRLVDPTDTLFDNVIGLNASSVEFGSTETKA